MTAPSRCPKCDGELPQHVLHGICPRCLARAMQADRPEPRPFLKSLRTPQSELPNPSLPSFGDYELLEEIARGGMGVVYKARQRKLNRIVAVKMLLFGKFASDSFVKRFEIEAEAVASLRHPNIVGIHEIGERDGQPFFSMDYVEGRNLAEWIGERGRPAERALRCTGLVPVGETPTGAGETPALPNQTTRVLGLGSDFRRAARLMATLAEAVHYAHQHGVLHRDLKPSNILIDVEGEPHITDFGLAKRMTGDSDLTLTGQMLGSPNYAAPEQSAGPRDRVDVRSDVYSLGAILYHMLTDRPPFVAETIEETLLRARTTEPVAPRSLNPGVPMDMETICLKCLEKDAARRFGSAEALGEDLQRWLRGESILARPSTAWEKACKWIRRKPVIAGLAAAVAFTVVLGFIGVTWQWRRAVTAEREQTFMRRKAEAHAYASDMSRAQQALSANNLGQAVRILDRHRPSRTAVSDQLSVDSKETRGPDPLTADHRLLNTDLRGWEWRYLWSQSRSDAQFLLCQKTNSTTSLAVSHDGRWVAIGEAGAVSVWDLPGKTEIMSWPVGIQPFTRVAFSPCQFLLAFSTVAGTNQQHVVRFWDGTNGKFGAELPLGARCLGMAFSDDGQTLAISTTHPDNLLTLWRVSDGTKLAEYPQRHDPEAGTRIMISPFAATRDLSVAADATPEGRIRVIDLATGKERWSTQAAPMKVKALAFSPDGKVLASSADDVSSAIRLWDVTTRMEIGRLDGDGGSSLVFWPDGKTLASAGGGQIIQLWDLRDLKSVPPPRTLRGHRNAIWSLALLPDNRTLVSGARDRSVLVWDTTTIRHEQNPVILPGILRAWRFYKQSVLTIDSLGRVARHKGANFQENEPLFEIGTNLLGTTISDDGRFVAAHFRDDVVRVWDLERQHPPRQFLARNVRLNLGKFVEHGKRLLLPDHFGGLHEWDLATLRETRSWPGFAQPLAFAVTPNEQLCLMIALEGGDSVQDMAAGRMSARLIVLRKEMGDGSLKDLATTGEIRRRLDVGQAVDAAFSPDGKLFAAPSLTGFGTLWETASLQKLTTFQGFLGSVFSVTFSPDGKRLAFGSAGKEAIKLWDVESQQELLTLEVNKDSFRSFRGIAFSPNGNVLGMTREGVLHLWRAPSWEEIEAAEKAQAATIP